MANCDRRFPRLKQSSVVRSLGQRKRFDLSWVLWAGTLTAQLDRVWLIVLPHLSMRTREALNRSLQNVELIWEPLLFLRRLRERKPDAQGLRPLGTSAPEVERLTLPFMLSIPLRCPQETVLPTLPPRLNAKKSVHSPLQRTTFIGVVWDSTSMQARLSLAR